MYDAVVGRWTSTDPYGQYWSPYLGMGNDPINGVDSDGGYFFGLFGSTSQQRQGARQLAALKGGEVLDITSAKNIAVTWTETFSVKGEVGYQRIHYTQDFGLEKNLSMAEAVTFNAFQGDGASLGILRDAGLKNLALDLHFQGMQQRAGENFFQFGSALATAPLSLGATTFVGAGFNLLGRAALNGAKSLAARSGFRLLYDVQQKSLFTGLRSANSQGRYLSGFMTNRLRVQLHRHRLNGSPNYLPHLNINNTHFMLSREGIRNFGFIFRAK